MMTTQPLTLRLPSSDKPRVTSFEPGRGVVNGLSQDFKKRGKRVLIIQLDSCTPEEARQMIWAHAGVDHQPVIMVLDNHPDFKTLELIQGALYMWEPVHLAYRAGAIAVEYN